MILSFFSFLFVWSKGDTKRIVSILDAIIEGCNINKRDDITDLSLDFNLRLRAVVVNPSNEVDESKLAVRENRIWYPANLAFRIQVHHVLDCFVLSIDNYRNSWSVAQSAPQCRCRGAGHCYLYNPGKTCPSKNKYPSQHRRCDLEKSKKGMKKRKEITRWDEEMEEKEGKMKQDSIGR